MKTKLTYTLFLLFFGCFAFGQNEDYKQEAASLEKSLKESKDRNTLLENEFATLKGQLSSTVSDDLNEKIENKQLEIQKEQKKFDSLYTLASGYKNVLENIKKVDKKNLDTLFAFIKSYKPYLNNENSKSEKKEETYLYFDDDKLVKETDLATNKTKFPFLEELFNMKSETYLGDFRVPQKGQVIALYDRKCDSETIFCSEKIEKTVTIKPQTIKLEKVSLNIKEGSVNEITVILRDEEKKLLVFENKYPVSLLRFSSIAPKTSLRYFYSTPTDKNIRVVDTAYINTVIRFSDILSYIPNPGDNYVPDDLTLTFPQGNETDNTNVTYKVVQDTSLKNVLELRAYTDFLGLFNNSDNGLVQLEGRADFYVNPFNITNSRWFIFKKLVPYVNFSRLDSENKYINIAEQEKENNGTNYIMNSSRDLRLQSIEKAYLDMGFRAYLISYAFSKESPFSASLYVPIRFLISNAEIPALNQKFELKTFGIGAGLNLSFRKFNNFILNYNVEYTEFKFSEFNSIKNFENPDAFYTFTNEAEVSYYPGKQKNQSAFVRFRVITNSEKDIHDSFYQFHFGYRFTIPLSTLKK